MWIVCQADKCQALFSLKNVVCHSCDCFRVKYGISRTNCHMYYWLRSDFLLKLLESPVFPSASCRPSDQVPSYFSSQVTVGIFCVSFLITLIKSWFMRKINLKHEIWKTKRKYIYKPNHAKIRKNFVDVCHTSVQKCENNHQKSESLSSLFS